MAENVWARVVNSTSPIIIVEDGGITKANVFATALPTAEADILTEAIAPSADVSYFQISVCMATAGVFRATITRESTTIIVDFWQGANLQANALYTFPLSVREGDTVNFRYSTTGANINLLRVEEVPR